MTDKNRQIKAVLVALLPRGPIWNPKPNGDFDKLLSGMGDNAQDVFESLSDLRLIRDPNETTLLSDLEKEYGIVSIGGRSEELRRSVLGGKVYRLAGTGSLSDLQNALTTAGFDLAVRYNSPLTNPTDYVDNDYQTIAGESLAQAGEASALAGMVDGDLIANLVWYDEQISDYIVEAGEAWVQAGEAEALAGDFVGVKNEFLDYRLDDPSRWPLVFYVAKDFVEWTQIIRDWNMIKSTTADWIAGPSTQLFKSFADFVLDKSDLVAAYDLYPVNGSIIDKSSIGIDGTPKGDMLFNLTPFRGMGIFDGVDDYIELEASSYLQFQRDDEFTISFWLKRDINGVAEGFINYRNTSFDGWEIGITSSNEIYFSLSSSSLNVNRILSPSKTLVDFDWHHLVFVYGGLDINSKPIMGMFLDGREIEVTLTDDDCGATISYSQYPEIGTDYNKSSYFNGLIANVKIYEKDKDENWINNEYWQGYSELYNKVRRLNVVPLNNQLPQKASLPVNIRDENIAFRIRVYDYGEQKIRDLAGNYNGTSLGGPAANVFTNWGRGLNFNSANPDRINLGPSALAGLTTFTITAIIKTDVGSINHIILSRDNVTVNRHFDVYVGSDNKLKFLSGSSGYSGQTLTPGNYYFVGVTVAGTSLVFYAYDITNKNSTAPISRTIPVLTDLGSTDTLIGCQSNAGLSAPFDGDMLFVEAFYDVKSEAWFDEQYSRIIKQCVCSVGEFRENIVDDGNMDRNLVSRWTAVNNAVLVKSSSGQYDGAYSLLISKNVTAYPSAAQAIDLIYLPTPYTYEFFGRAKSDGVSIPEVWFGDPSGAGVKYWTGTSSTSWQYIYFSFTDPASNVLYLSSQGTLGTGVAFDSVFVIPVSKTDKPYEYLELTDDTGNFEIISQDVILKANRFGFGGEYICQYDLNKPPVPIGYADIDTSDLGNSFSISAWLKTKDVSKQPIVFFAGDSLTIFQFEIGIEPRGFLYLTDSSNYICKTNLGYSVLQDGYMEKSGVTLWTATQSTLSKVTASPIQGYQNLKINHDGVNPHAYAEQSNVFTIGNSYRIRGFTRSNGTTQPSIWSSAPTTIWTGSTSTDWQYFDIVWVADSTGIKLRSYKAGATVSDYTEFDMVSVEELMLKDGDMEYTDTSKWTVGGGAVLTKETASPKFGIRNLRVTNPGGGYVYATQSPFLLVGETYRLTGYCRGDGSAYATVQNGTGSGLNLFNSTPDNVWQFFDLKFVAEFTFLRFYNGSSLAGYVEFDDIKIEQIFPKLNDNLYRQIQVNYDSTDTQLFLDGKPITGAIAIVPGGTPSNKSLRIGASGFYSLNDAFEGSITAVRVYTDALSESDINDQYNTDIDASLAGSYAEQTLDESFQSGVDLDTEGLVAAYDLKISNERIYDKSENKNDGIAEGNIESYETPFDGVAYFDGVNDAINCGNDTSFDIEEKITISVWVKAYNLGHVGGGNNPRIMEKNGAYRIYASPSNDIVFRTIGTSPEATTALNCIYPSNDWIHIVVVYNKSVGRKTIYINGEKHTQQSGITGSISVSSQNVVFGDNIIGGSRKWNGLIARPKIYNVAKSEAWVKDEYQKGLYSLNYTGEQRITATVKGDDLTACREKNIPAVFVFDDKLQSWQEAIFAIDNKAQTIVIDYPNAFSKVRLYNKFSYDLTAQFIEIKTGKQTIDWGQIPNERRDELRDIILDYKPLHSWCALLAEYI